jgi:hypothetical protein
MTPPPRDPLSDTWPEDIDARVSSIEARVRVVSAGHAHLADQIAEIAVSQHRAEQHRRVQDQKLEALQVAMATNTELTSKTLAAVQTVSDVMTTARTGGRFFRWLAPTLIAAGIAVGTVKGWWMAGLDLFDHTPPK